MKNLIKPVVLFILIVSLTLTACTASPVAAPTEVPTRAPTTPSLPTSAPEPTPVNQTAPEESGLEREDAQGNVVVIVTPLNLDLPSDTLDFDIALDTHSVDLKMDLTALAELTTDTGLSVKAVKWDAPMGGHHVAGTLSFPAIIDGAPLLEGVTTLTLTLLNVDVPERTFTWQIIAE
ncbi:MAG TPA: hypothetical protein DCP32_00085 [Anaerolineaceae bacterium]|nr:MAG: hypothetical protein A2X24_01585 [Chloroflexi bacterium GWB2_54_36]HAL15186.1 hypothetical protein [Anaerolineaceae bacterium]HBA92532.1 hypothetical protein [Anaerolineaceae bacterium]